MTFIEWIGFFIAMLVLLFSVLRRLAEERGRREHPEEYDKVEEERRRAYRELMQSMGMEVEEGEAEEPAAPPPRARERQESVVRANRPRHGLLERQSEPHRTLSDDFEFHADLDSSRQLGTVEQRHLDTRVKPRFSKDTYGKDIVSSDLQDARVTKAHKERPSRVSTLVGSMPSKKMLIVANEIIAAPIALRSEERLFDC